MEKETWLKARMQLLQENYEAEIALAKDWAGRIESGLKQVKVKIPQVLDNLHNQQYQVDQIKRVGNPGFISEFVTIVSIGTGAYREIYGVHFSDDDFPNLGIKKGFNVKHCSRQDLYRNHSDLFGRPNIWVAVQEDEEQFMDAVGLTLIERMPMLTEDELSEDLHKVLEIFDEQIASKDRK